MIWNFSTFKKVFVTLLLVLPGILLVPSATAAFKYLNEGMKAPTVTGLDIKTGEKISTSAYTADNNLLIVVFWSSWSKRSLEELDALKEIYNDLGEKPVKIVAINVDSEELVGKQRQLVLDLIAAKDLPFPVIIDDGLDIFYEFGVIAVPSTAILDSSGILRYGPAGYSLTTKDLIIDSIEVLLGLKSASVTTVVKKGYSPKKRSLRYYGLAVNLNRKRSYERALSNLELSIEADTNFAVPYSLRGEIYLSLDKVPLAIEAFKKATELDTTFVAAWAGYGQALLRDNQVEESLVKLGKALELDYAFTPAFLDLGLCLAEQNKYQEALDSLNKALELNLKDPLIHFYIGKTYLKSADTSSAANSFKTALEILYP